VADWGDEFKPSVEREKPREKERTGEREDMVEQVPTERVVDGLGVSPGIAIGIAQVRESGAVNVPEYRIAATKVTVEQRRLKDAVARARRQIARLRIKARRRTTNMPDAASDELGYLLDAYFHMLKDSRLVRGAIQRIATERINAEAAVQAEIDVIAEAFHAMHDPYLAARIEDIRQVGKRLVKHLTKAAVPRFMPVPKGSVIVAEEMTPADTAQLDPERVVGIAVQVGGSQSHTAIMARALGLPAVLGAPGLMAAVKTGDHILIDGDLGQIVFNPSPASLAVFRRRRGERLREKRQLKRLAKQAAVTRDGVEIELQANVELPMEMNNVAESGAAGIGLLRSEFMFMNRPTMPNEDEQYAALRKVVEKADGNPVTIRTLDFGGDRGASALVGEFGESITSPLGVRGIRLSLARSELLETQFRAILRAGAHGDVRILLPMVTMVSEIRAAREILARAARRLHRRGADIPTALPPLGTMIEVPGAALSADALAQASDFFAVGSNDLTMYTLAIDRGDEWVAHLYNPLHPGVLRLIQFAAAAALRARIPVSICGEIAGDPRYTALLLGLGFRELSMIASSIPQVKQRILDIDLVTANRRTQLIMDQTDATRIQSLLDEFNASVGAEDF